MYVCTDTHIYMNIFIIEWSLSLSQYLFRLREGSSCSPKEKNSCFKGNYKNCSFVLHFFHTDFVAVWLWSENELQKLKAVKFSWISLSISVYYLKTLLQPNPTLNHEINQSFLIRSRLRKKNSDASSTSEPFEHFTVLAMLLLPAQDNMCKPSWRAHQLQSDGAGSCRL